MLLSTLSLLLLGATARATDVIKVDGSSTVFPLTEAMAEEFQSVKKGAVQVTVGISGTGGGFKKFCRGETDIQDASRPISVSEMETCQASKVEYIELPVAYDAIVVVVNPKNNILSDISKSELNKMWQADAQGKVNAWNLVNPAWPNLPLKLFGAGSDSGTFDFFTETINGKAKSSRGDYAASEDDNTIVTGIGSDKNALGYLPLAYYLENKAKLKALTIEKTAPTVENVSSAKYLLSRPVFIYVKADSLKKAAVKEFAEFYLSKADQLAPEVKMVSIGAKNYAKATEILKKSKTGTIFEGKEAHGLKIEDLLKKASK